MSNVTFDPTGLIIGTGVSILGSIFGGNKAASAARQQAELQNQATERRYEYDTQMWDMKREQLINERDHAVKTIQIQAGNESKSAAFTDAVNLQRYNRDLQIRNAEQKSLNEQFIRSDDIYNKQLTLNALAAKAGREDEYRKLQEIHAEATFDRQEAIIQQLQTEGKLRARGMDGRAIQKGAQVTLADLGNQIALFNESLSSAGRNTRAVLEEIARDKASADLAAYAQKMLDPGILPDVIVPFATPMADFLYPREFTEADFGPQPVRGAMASPSAAASRVWGETISGIAGTLGGAFNTYIDKSN